MWPGILRSPDWPGDILLKKIIIGLVLGTMIYYTIIGS
jgi:hypothetical protein